MVLAATMTLMLAATPAFAQTDFQNTYMDGGLAKNYLGEAPTEQYLDVQIPTNVVPSTGADRSPLP